MINPNRIHRSKFTVLKVIDYLDFQKLTIKVNKSIIEVYGPDIRLNKKGEKRLLTRDSFGRYKLTNKRPLQIGECYSGQFRFSIMSDGYSLIKLGKQHKAV